MDDYDPNSIIIEDALKQIKKISKKLNSYEYVDLLDAHNRIVYENIKSKLSVPNYDNSAMDGYALNIKDTKINNIFKVVGTSLAGLPFKGKIKKIVADHLGIDEAKVTEESSFIDDLGADSLDTVELVMAFEEEFGSEISDSEAEKILTVGDAVKFIEGKAN